MLTGEVVEQMFSAPALIRAADAEKKQNELHYGFGWLRWNAGDGRLVNSHNGALACTAAAPLMLSPRPAPSSPRRPCRGDRISLSARLISNP